MKNDRILVIGSCGQIGTELTVALRERYGDNNVIAADVHSHDPKNSNYVQLDVLEHEKLKKTVIEQGITQIYLLAAMLSAKGEGNTHAAWKLNMQSLISVLDIAKEQNLVKVFWPSSIAVFGPGSPKHNCPQDAVMEPNTVYGISKRAGEHWCSYYFEKFGVDARSIRYPGLISSTSPAGGGTTDYAVDIFHQAIEKRAYTCFLNEDTCLPMLYMPDAIRATLELMEAPMEKISIRTSYNLAGMSFAPCDLTEAIRKHIPNFEITYRPDYRQAIANSWPASIKDEQARKDWGWKPTYDLKSMASDMLEKLSAIKGVRLNEYEPVLAGYPDFPGN